MVDAEALYGSLGPVLRGVWLGWSSLTTRLAGIVVSRASSFTVAAVCWVAGSGRSGWLKTIEPLNGGDWSWTCQDGGPALVADGVMLAVL